MDPNCLSFNGNFCVRCSTRYYVYGDGKCVPVNPLCKDHNLRGECTECYRGYEINSGKCVIESPKDPNCKTSNGNFCVECYQGFYYSQGDRACKRLNPLCKTSNLATGACLTCYPGYNLNQRTGQCEVFFKDPNCLQFNLNNICMECANRFYLASDNKCMPVNPLCKTSSPANGACLTCYPGYTLSGRDCVVGSERDANCQTFNGELCVKCYKNFYLNSGSGKCMAVNPLCRTSNEFTGECTSCYPGYEIIRGGCEVAQSTDPNCKTLNGNQCI